MTAFTCAGFTKSRRPCRNTAGAWGYCTAHDPGDHEPAVFLGEHPDEAGPCSRCGSDDDPPTAGLVGYLWGPQDRPLCGACLEALDPVLSAMVERWDAVTGDLTPDQRRHLHLALVNDLDTHHIGSLRRSAW